MNDETPRRREPDETESKVRQWATKRNGDPLTPRDVVELVLAVDDDANRRETRMERRFEEHVIEAARRDRRIESIEQKLLANEAHCPEVIEQAIVEAVARSEAKHEHRHEKYVASMTKPRRKGDTNGKDYRREREESRQVWLMWMVGSKVSYVLLAAIITAINIGLHYLFMSE